MDESPQTPWPGGIDAITLFVDDLSAAKRFYADVFGLPVHYEMTPRPCSGSARRS